MTPQTITNLYNPVLQTNMASSSLMQQMQRRRQERLLRIFTPEIQPRAGAVQQFIHGTTAPIQHLAAKVGLTDKPSAPKPQGIMENITYSLGNILTYSTMLSPILQPVMAGLSAALGATALSPIVQKAALSAATGALYGGASAYIEDRPIIPTTVSRAITGAGMSFVGSGISHVFQKMRQQVVNPLERLMEDKINFPETPADMENFTRLLKYMPDELKLEGYKDSLRDITEAMQPGGSLEKMTQAQRDYFLGKMQDPLEGELDKNIRVLVGVLRNIPEGEKFAKNIIKTAGETQYGSLLKAKGRLGDLARRAMRAMTPVDLPPEPDIKLRYTKGAESALEGMKEATTLSEQFSYAEEFSKEVTNAYKRFLKSHKSDSLEQLLHDPSKSAATFKAAQRHIVKRNQAQDILWNIQKKFSADLKLVDPKDISSRVLSEAFGKSLGNIEVTRLWHPRLQVILETVNGKTGRSFSGLEDMEIAFNEGEIHLGEFINQWKQTADTLKELGEPTLYAQYASTVTALPDDIDKIIADKRNMVPKPPAILSRPPASEAEAALRKNAEAAYNKLVQKQKEYDIVDYIQEKIKDSKIAPSTLHEELVLSTTKPNSLFSRLIPTRYLFGKTFTNVAREATFSLQAFNEKYLGYETGMKQWIEDSGIPKHELAIAGKRIGDMLESNGYNINQKTLAKLAHYDESSLAWQKISEWLQETQNIKPSELRIAAKMRDAFNEIFDRAGIEDARFIEQYYPHFRQIDETVIAEIQKRLEEVSAKPDLIEGYTWVNKLVRSGSLQVYEENAFSAFARYVSGASKSIYYDPLFSTWSKAFKEMNLDPARQQLFKQLQSSMLGRPTETESQIDTYITTLLKEIFGKELPPGYRPTRAMTSFLVEMQNAGGIAGNPFAIVKNLTQKILILPELTDDPDKWVEGIPMLYKYKATRNTPLGKMIDSFNPIMQNRQFAEGMTYGHSAIVSFMDRLGVGERTTQKIMDAGYAGYRWADIDNVKDAFGAQFLRLLSKGAPVEEAAEMATATAMSTQFMYGLDSPMLYKTSLGKVLGVFMSWPLNWAYLLYEQGTEESIRKAFATVGAMAIGSSALSLTGFNFMSTHPANVARGILPLAMIEGQEDWPVSLKLAASSADALRALVRGDQTEIDNAFDNLRRRVELMIPFGVGTSRLVRFINTAKDGWKEYDTKQRFRRDISVSEGLRSIIGPTIEAEQRRQDYQLIQSMEADYRRLRAQAIQAYMDGNLKKFKDRQERLLLNYGNFIDVSDIKKELDLRSASSVERQLMGLPKHVREQFMLQRGYSPTVTERRQMRLPRWR